jgi:hypothetical protein
MAKIDQQIDAYKRGVKQDRRQPNDQTTPELVPAKVSTDT